MSTKKPKPGRTTTSTSASNSIRLIGQQSKYLTHLQKQLVKLHEHTGSFGSVEMGLEATSQEARLLGVQLETVEGELSQPPPPPSTDLPPAPVVEPDLDAMANQLEALARRIQEMEGLADVQSVGLKKDLARVMEVFEDPAAFLPTPCKTNTYDQPPPVTSVPSTNPQTQKSKEAKQIRFSSPALNTSNLTSPLPLADATNTYPYTNLYRNVAQELEEFDGGSPIAPHQPEPVLNKSMNEDPTASGPPPPDPLDQFRASVARQVQSWRNSKSLAESAEEVRRLAKEAAASNREAAAKLHALSNKEPLKRSIRRGGRQPAEPEEVVVAPPAPRLPPRPKPSRAMRDPELYPWTSQLQEIFKGVKTSEGPFIPTAPIQPFNGLAQSIPAYLEYQAYLQQQLLAQERERQEQEAQRLLEEKREYEEAQARAAEEARLAKLKAMAPPVAVIEPVIEQQQQPLPPPPQPIPSLPVEKAVVNTAIQTSPRFDYHRPLQPMVEQPALLINGQPSHQILGQHIPRFDAIWDVLPHGRDVAVQSEQPTNDAATAPMLPRTHRTTGPSLPSSPTHAHAQAPTPSARTHNGQIQPPLDGQQRESIRHNGGGAPLTTAVNHSRPQSALTTIEQAALDLQLQSKLRGEGLSSARALESLLATAGAPTNQLVEVLQGNSQDTSLTVPPHPLFSGQPSQPLVPNSGLLSLVLQMYDMPTDQQINQEWTRVLAEEEAANELRKEKEAETAQPKEELKQPEPEKKEDTVPSAPPGKTPAELAFEAELQQQQAAESERKRVESEAAAAHRAQLEEQQAALTRQREMELEAARKAAEEETRRMVEELKRIKDEAAAAIEHAKSAAATISPPPQPVPATVPAAASTSTGLTPQQFLEFEAEARRRWQAEQDAAKAAALAQIEAEAKAAALAAATATEQARLAAAAAVARAAEPDIPPAVAKEIERIRAQQAAEQAMFDQIRRETSDRWQEECQRREEERVRYQKQQAEEEARYQARKLEREAEEKKREELEQRREELLVKKMELERERMKKDLETLRASMEKLKYQRSEVSTLLPPPSNIPIAFLNRTPLTSYQPKRPLDDTTDTEDSSFTSSSELGNTNGSGIGKHDLSEGEIDLGVRRTTHSPGLLPPPNRIPKFNPAKLTKKPHSAATLHPPIPSVTPARPTRDLPNEEKYPSHYNATSLNTSSSTRDEIGDLLRQSQTIRESINSNQSVTRSADVPIRTVQDIPYSSAISQMKKALAAPSRQVLVGSVSPPLVESDLSAYIRDSIDPLDFGQSTDNIGGLFGMERTRPDTANSNNQERQESAPAPAPGVSDLIDDVSLSIDDSFHSPKQTETEKWLRSLKD